MVRPTSVLAAVVCLGATLSSQSPPGNRPVLVTSDRGLILQAWRAGTASPERTWEATPRSALADTANRRAEAVLALSDSRVVVADADADGALDLVVMDPLGITVYGRSPAYYPFESVAVDSYSQAVIVTDVDGDGGAELVTHRSAEKGREIEIWKRTATGLSLARKQTLEGSSSVLLWADADNDGKGDLVTTSATGVLVLKDNGQTWEVTAEMPHDGGGPSAVCVADVDADGKNEVVAAGNNGKVTVYEHARRGGRQWFAVSWQSPYLMTLGLRPLDGRPPTGLVTHLATGDIDGDARLEIVAGTYDYGLRPDQETPATGRLRAFRFDGQRDFAPVGVSDWLTSPALLQVSIDDLDGDGRAEVIYGGRDVYRYDQSTGTLGVQTTVCASCSMAVTGAFGELREPAGASRIVPLYWSVQNRQLIQQRPAAVALTLYSPWSEAKDVTVSVTSTDSGVAIANGVVQVKSIPAKGTAVMPPVTVTAQAGQSMSTLRIEITAAGGYRQVVPVRVYATAAPPDYEAGDIERRIAGSLSTARHENQRVLVMWGARGDKGSEALLDATRRNAEVSRTVLYEYVVVRADVSRDRAPAAKYRADLAKGGLPYLTLLDAEGKVLANQPASAFKTASPATTKTPAATGPASAIAYDGASLNTFLKKHQAAYLEAEPLFNEALSRAKKEQKTLFVWFSAPW